MPPRFMAADSHSRSLRPPPRVHPSTSPQRDRAFRRSFPNCEAVLIDACVSISSASRFIGHDFNQLGDDLELLFIRTGEDDRLEVRIDGFQRDVRMAPRIPVLCLLAFVAFDGVALAGFGIGGVPELDENGLALARPLDRRAEEALRAVRDRRLHGLADNLGDEHAGA
jgi:hypothetical protein